MSVQNVATGYTPRPLQKDLHSSLKRMNVLVCHRRFGKTVFSLNEMIDQALRCRHERPRYAYISPTYGQSKRVAWDYLKAFTKDIPGVKVNEAELRVDFPTINEARISLLGADNYNNLRGIYLDGAVLDEYAEMHPAVWGEVIRPMLTDRQGWAIFIGTPKGRNHFWEKQQQALNIDDEWYTVTYKASDTGIIPKSELDRMRQEMSEAEYEQEMECSFDSMLVGAYYAKEMKQAQLQGRICTVPWDKALTVHTAWDLGISDSNVIWSYQQIGNRVQLIDCNVTDGKGLDDHAKYLNSKPWNFGTHFLPHDAGSRELTSGKTRVQMLQRLLRGQCRVLPRGTIDDGINAARMLLPRCWFDEDSCQDGIEALRAYRRKFDSKNDTFVDRPLHNWASHAADGFRVLAMGLRDDAYDAGDFPRSAITEYDIYSA